MRPFIAVALLSFSCGSMQQPVDAGVAGGSAGGSSMAGGAAGGSAGGAAGGATAGGSGSVGTIFVLQNSFSIANLPPMFVGVVTGSFFTGLPGSCPVTMVGGCEVTDCSAFVDAGVPDGGAPTGRSAGTLTFKGVLTDGGLSVPFVDGGYSASVGQQLFALGRPLTVEASGAEIPAFSATVTAPEGTLLTAPVCANAACGSVSKSADLDVRWTAPTFGDVEIQLIASPVLIRCQLPASTRMKTIPAAALRSVGTGTGLLFVGGAARTTVRAGITDVTFSVRDATYGTITVTP
jgi:hypothetical protein